ncbi:MAG TPA: PqqD family protein [Candidatus Acidoferrum sp.]|nr:PqqD family protein [Candidatus Acidoferrum sp.]
MSKDQVSCDLQGEAAILHLKSGVYYGLDPVGARIWTLVQQPKTFSELRSTLLGEYDVEAARLEADLRDLLNKLAEQGLVEISE